MDIDAGGVVRAIIGHGNGIGKVAANKHRVGTICLGDNEVGLALARIGQCVVSGDRYGNSCIYKRNNKYLFRSLSKMSC